MGFAEKFFRQCRRPEGFPGRLAGRAMNTGHARVRRWGLSYVSAEPHAAVLDVGCGGGGALRDMAALYPGAKLFGIDYSRDMVLLAKKVNKKLIEKDRIEITYGSVSFLPYSDNTFDLVTAFEAYYFWPDLDQDLQEIKRVLAPKGKLLLVNEVYENEKFRIRNNKFAAWATMHIHSPEGYQKFLTKAGYEAIEIHEMCEKNWIAAVGKKNE
ncbi:MAG: class I SAM-dependent methyltransferase [Syntrophales bacterium]|jgi:ubiquinone/menaquinone biosynthesis C-methylase UbiE|nr:class I SAM-dependent methyltransferase [Syntrophales bacterium]